MQVTIDKEYPVAASAETAWQLLTNIHELTSCMPGAQITEDIDATHYKGSVKVKVGPAVAAFAGTIEILAVDESARSLRMVGKGADKGGSSASMDLTATLRPGSDGACVLNGKADVIVNGKFAQFGGRMMNSVSDVILAQFAAAFSQKAQAVKAAEPVAASTTASLEQEGLSTTAVQASQVAPSNVPLAPTQAPAAPTELNAFALAWAVLRNWFLGLFGRKT